MSDYLNMNPTIANMLPINAVTNAGENPASQAVNEGDLQLDGLAALFRDHYNIPLIHVQAQDMFLGALSGVSDPEVKRKTIGKLFIDVFDAEAAKWYN